MDFIGNVKRYKTRLITKKFTQKKCVNYKETFSLESTKDFLRIIITLVTHFKLKLYHMNVKITFFNNDIDKTIYIV